MSRLSEGFHQLSGRLKFLRRSSDTAEAGFSWDEKLGMWKDPYGNTQVYDERRKRYYVTIAHSSEQKSGTDEKLR
jgi:hypothetical protein